MSNLSKIGLALAMAAVIVGCGKKRNTLVPSNAGPARGTVIKNLVVYAKINEAARASGVQGELCAQLVKSTVAATKDRNMVEVSQGPCPSNNALVDDTKTTVVAFFISQPISNGNNWAQITPATGDFRDQTYGEVLYAPPYTADDITKQTPNTLEDLCTDNGTFNYGDFCYFKQSSDGKFAGVDYSS